MQVFDLGENGGAQENNGTLLASHTETGYTCERMQTYRVLFDKPVLLTAKHWYLAYAAISSPVGASSDAGSSGQQEVQGPDKLDNNCTVEPLYCRHPWDSRKCPD